MPGAPRSRTVTRKANADLSVIGQTGLKRFAGRVYEEFLTELTGDRWRRVVKEMYEQDPVVGAIQFAFEMLLRRVEWSMQPFDESPAAQADADFVEECRHDMSISWPDLVAEILSMLPFGWAYFEEVYKIRGGLETDDPTRRSKFNDGRIGWRKFGIRSQDTLWRWEFDEEGEVLGMWQMAPPHYRLTFLPIEKGLLFRTTTRKGNPEGRSIYRNAYRPWYFKKHIENIEGVGVERDLAGIPVLYVPADLLDPNAPQAKKAALAEWEKLVTAIKRDEQEGIILPSTIDPDSKQRLYELKLLTSGGTRQFNTSEIINRKNQEMAMSCLADVILLGHEQVGSFALAESKGNLMTAALGSFLDVIAAVFNNHAIPRLFRINGMPTDTLPQLVHGDLQPVNLVELAAYITALSGAGAPLFPNPDLENYLLEAAGLPTTQEGEDEDAGKPKVKPPLSEDENGDAGESVPDGQANEE